MCLEVWLWLYFKVFFTQKCIKIIFFLILKKSFFILAHQNDPKTLKKILILSKNKFLKTQVGPLSQTIPQVLKTINSNN
jgi:hypothetical protein